MIYEFAVEPDVMATWEHFRVLWDDFGVSRGRLLVEFPKHWRREVYEKAVKLSPPVRANAICSRISDEHARRHKMVGPSGRAFGGEHWRENAEQQQAGERRFRAIVAATNPTGQSDVIVADELDRDAAPWKVDRQDLCPRNAQEIYRRVATLLDHSEELLLVDPYFDPTEPRFALPFESLVERKGRAGWKRLKIHRKMPKLFLRDVQSANYRKLAPAVPLGTTLTVYFWPGMPKGEQMHPRFVLTERGGVNFEKGLDEGRSPAETTLASLLEDEVFLKLRADYDPDGRTFGVPERIEVQGRA